MHFRYDFFPLSYLVLVKVRYFGFCHSPIDIRASTGAGSSADRRGREREN